MWVHYTHQSHTSAASAVPEQHRVIRVVPTVLPAGTLQENKNLLWQKCRQKWMMKWDSKPCVQTQGRRVWKGISHLYHEYLPILTQGYVESSARGLGIGFTISRAAVTMLRTLSTILVCFIPFIIHYMFNTASPPIVICQIGPITEKNTRQTDIILESIFQHSWGVGLTNHPACRWCLRGSPHSHPIPHTLPTSHFGTRRLGAIQ